MCSFRLEDEVGKVANAVLLLQMLKAEKEAGYDDNDDVLLLYKLEAEEAMDEAGKLRDQGGRKHRTPDPWTDLDEAWDRSEPPRTADERQREDKKADEAKEDGVIAPKVG